jgi:catalase-peroxidase
LRFAPLNSWPDNGNLDKARRLLWPIKQKYGHKISWSDLFILTGNVALESMGFPTFGFAGGRADVWEPEDDVNWGQETTWLNGDLRYKNNHERALDNPLGAVQMGLIYVNPEGPNSNPDPIASAKDIRDTFGRMAMNDEETVALIAGGHTFGKCHGAGDAAHVGTEPEGASIEQQGLGWRNILGQGKGKDTITSGLEGAWTYDPTKWDHQYFAVLFGYEWELTKSPAGAYQWTPKGSRGQGKVADAHDPSVRHPPIMLTSDLALRYDPVYAKISRRFYQNPKEFQEAFAKAWYKLTHRDMGPYARCLGPEVPPPQLWQDPIPSLRSPPIDATDQIRLKQVLLDSNISITRLVTTAWASASTFRCTDKRGGANGARIRLAPQKDWTINEPAELSATLATLETIQRKFNATSSVSKVSMADLIVLGGCVGVEAAAKAAGYDVQVPFTAGRSDATQEVTDSGSFGVLEPIADGFRNYVQPGLEGARAEELLVDKAYMLSLTAPEMVVLLGGLRVLGIGCETTSPFTDRVGVLSNDFFRNLLDIATVWTKAEENLYEGRARSTGKAKWTASRVDLVLGSHSVLRALAEVHACSGSEQAFVRSFCTAFAKVMDLDRFDVTATKQLSRL